MSVAPHAHGWASSMVGVFLNGITFAVLGPPIGSFFSIGVIFWPLAAIASYVTSTWAAFVTGCCVGLASRYLTRPRNLYVFAAATGAILGGAVPYTIDGYPPGANEAAVVVMFAFSGLMAALVCTRVTRGLRLVRADRRPEQLDS